MSAFQPDVLRGQRALVTGGSSGIGAAVARALAKAGGRVAINYRSDAEEADTLVNAITADGGEAMAVKADVSEEDQVQRMFKDMLGAWGGIEILVANAGIQRDAPFAEMTFMIVLPPETASDLCHKSDAVRLGRPARDWLT